MQICKNSLNILCLSVFVTLFLTCVMSCTQSGEAATHFSEEFTSCEDLPYVMVKTADNKTMPFRYFYDWGNGGPLVVYFPGGPGGSGTVYTRKKLGLPQDVGLFLYDPRGVGCNSSFKNTDDLTTEVLVNDIRAALQRSNLRPKIFYGASYGTVVATQLASRFYKNVQVVLEGIVGRSFLSREEQNASIINEWNDARAKLSEPVQEILKKGLTQYKPEIYGSFILGLLYNRTSGLGLDSVSIFEGVSPKASLLLRNYFQANIKEAAAGGVERDASFYNVYKYVGCREVFASDMLSGDFALNKDELEEIPGALCKGIPVTNVYDSMEFPLEQDVIYFTGDHDPVLPLWQTEYHYEYSAKGSATIYTVHGAGHTPLLYTLSQCREDVWNAIVEHSSIEAAFEQCRVGTRVTSIHKDPPPKPTPTPAPTPQM